MIVYDTKRNETDEGVLRQRNETAYTWMHTTNIFNTVTS